MSVLDATENPQDMGGALLQRVPEAGTTTLCVGSHIVVREGQVAVLVREGEPLIALDPGRHAITADTMTLLKDALGPDLDEGGPFDAEVYFVNAAEDVQVKWGTPEPISETFAGNMHTFQVRAFGYLDVQIPDPWQFVIQTVVGQGMSQPNEVRDRLREAVLQSLREALEQFDRPGSEIPQSADDLATAMRAGVQESLATLGITFKALTIEHISAEDTSMIDGMLKFGGQHTVAGPLGLSGALLIDTDLDGIPDIVDTTPGDPKPKQEPPDEH
jgi:membrane protease subunit (stomatin/prohibitin family)